MNTDKTHEALSYHEKLAGKIEVISRAEISNAQDLALAYTPGVAKTCLAIAENPEDSWRYTRRSKLVCVLSDGSAVLGLGNIGPAAAMPVMEGKCALFKRFGDVDAFPLCVDTQDPESIIELVCALAPSFGGINLEDIAAPKCFEIERELKRRLDIPVFHDDQHGTAIVSCAALINAAKLVGKELAALKVVISGAGAAGLAICELIQEIGLRDIVLCDSQGIVSRARAAIGELTAEKASFAERTNPRDLEGGLADALVGADVFVGVSAAGIVSREMVSSMAKDAIVFAMANPTPEIMPDEARAAGAAIVATGRSDFDNQINNVLAFPGIFKGALAARASEISHEMIRAATFALASIIPDEELRADYIIPDVFNPQVAEKIAAAVEVCCNEACCDEACGK